MKDTGEDSIDRLGKYGLIDHLARNATKNNKSTAGDIGDDAAVIAPGETFTLVSTDLLMEGIHFNLMYFPLRHLGYKSVIRAISDIYAMNGTPEQLLLAVGVSSRFDISALDEFYDGVYLACRKYGVDLAGGDITTSLTGFTISVTATGTVKPEKLVRRSGAKPNELICVTGNLGAAYMGLQLLERERRLFMKDPGFKPSLSGYEYIIERQLKPELPVSILNELNDKGIIPTSMIDLSEGLASDLLQLCKYSGTGCRIFHDKIPIDSETLKFAEEIMLEPLIAALNGGEDYEFLFTVPIEKYETIARVKGISIIGHMTKKEQGKYFVTKEGQEIELTAQGWRKELTDN